MNRILKTRTFQRWMRKTLLSDAILRTAIDEMQAGLVDADLGGGVFKKRIAVPGRGKRGGARTIAAATRIIVGFSCTDSRKMNGKTSDGRNSFP